jgi:hypothetical protein
VTEYTEDGDRIVEASGLYIADCSDGSMYIGMGDSDGVALYAEEARTLKDFLAREATP